MGLSLKLSASCLFSTCLLCFDSLPHTKVILVLCVFVDQGLVEFSLPVLCWIMDHQSEDEPRLPRSPPSEDPIDTVYRHSTFSFVSSLSSSHGRNSASTAHSLRTDESLPEAEHLRPFGALSSNDESQDGEQNVWEKPVSKDQASNSKKPGARWPKRSSLSYYFFDWWLLELSSMLLSLASAAAIVGVLAHYQDRPLSEWPYRITINTLISFLNSLAKGAVLLVVASAVSQLKWLWFHQSKAKSLKDIQLFDNASRGPLGALQLILHAPKGVLASFCSLVIIVSFGMDPFTQQVLSFPQRAVDGLSATIGRAWRYNDSDFEYYGPFGGIEGKANGMTPR